MDITVTLSEAEAKALGWVCADSQIWVDNVVKERCRRAMDAIYQAEVTRMLADPEISSIPADIEAVVLAADLTPPSLPPSPLGPA